MLMTSIQALVLIQPMCKWYTVFPQFLGQLFANLSQRCGRRILCLEIRALLSCSVFCKEDVFQSLEPSSWNGVRYDEIWWDMKPTWRNLLSRVDGTGQLILTPLGRWGHYGSFEESGSSRCLLVKDGHPQAKIQNLTVEINWIIHRWVLALFPYFSFELQDVLEAASRSRWLVFKIFTLKLEGTLPNLSPQQNTTQRGCWQKRNRYDENLMDFSLWIYYLLLLFKS